MKPSEVTTLLEHTIPAGLPVLLTGAPGVGKTSIVEQACQAIDADLIVSHPAVADPTDAKGLPFVVQDPETKESHATFLPFGELERACRATKQTVWFLDDLGQASPAVQASYMQLLLARHVNGHFLPDCVSFTAATNRRTDRAGVTGILEPIKSRFACIIELEPDLDDWCAWAIAENLAPELVAFLRFQSDLLCKFSASADLSNSPVPRTWHRAGQILALGLPADLQHKAIIGAVGEGAATEFSAFLKIAATLPSIDQILIDPKSAEVPKKPAVLYALSTALAYRATAANFARIGQFLQKMVDAGYGEFAVLSIKDAMRKLPALTSSAAFVKLVTMGDFKTLMAGE